MKGLSRGFGRNQHFVGDGFCSGGDPKRRAEGGVAGVAAVEVEDELVEVGLEMVAVQTVVDAQGPAFEVGEHAVGPLRDEGSGHGADTMGMVVDLGGSEIGGPSVGLERRTGGDIGRDESADTFGGIVGNGGETAWSAKRRWNSGSERGKAVMAGPSAKMFILCSMPYSRTCHHISYHRNQRDKPS